MHGPVRMVYIPFRQARKAAYAFLEQRWRGKALMAWFSQTGIFWSADRLSLSSSRRKNEQQQIIQVKRRFAVLQHLFGLCDILRTDETASSVW